MISNALLADCSAALMRWGEGGRQFVVGDINEALSYALVAYNSALRGMGKISVNEKEVKKVLNAHWEVLAEPIQIIMRREEVEGAYEQLKDLTRGKKVRKKDIASFIEGLDIDRRVKKELLRLRPRTYTGMARAS